MHVLAPLRKKCIWIIEVRADLAELGVGSSTGHVVGNCIKSACSITRLAACAVLLVGCEGGRCHAEGVAASHTGSAWEGLRELNVAVGGVSKGLHSIVQEAQSVGGRKEQDC